MNVQVKLIYPLTMRAIPERLRDVSCMGAIEIDITFIFTYSMKKRTHETQTLRAGCSKKKKKISHRH